ALLSADGEIMRGASIDNACHAETICAERTALVKAFVGLFSCCYPEYVKMAGLYSDVALPISPCCLCQQVLREFCPHEMVVLLVPGPGDKDEGVQETTLGELWPN
ncbi:cytidine deaminase-like protein, partial [Mycena floridula]